MAVHCVDFKNLKYFPEQQRFVKGDPSFKPSGGVGE